MEFKHRTPTEEELEESRERYRNIFESAPVGIFQSTLEGVFLRSNPVFARMCGYESPSELTKDVRDIATQLYARAEDRRAFLDELLAHNTWLSRQCEFRTRTGDTLNVTVTARAVRGTTGEFQYIEGFIEDITDRKLAEKALRESERRYRTLFEESMDAIYITDKPGILIEANRATMNLFGYSREEIIGLSARELYADDNERERLRNELRKSGSVRDFEIALKRSEGTRMDCIVSITQWQDYLGNVFGYLGIVRDVTARKRAERALMQVNENLEKRVEERTIKLRQKAKDLEEVNTALKVLLNQREVDREDLEEGILSSVRHLVLPYIERLGKTRLDDHQTTLLHILECHLGEVTSPFLRKLSTKYLGLTPTEIEVACLIREGKSTKEIAEILRISENTVISHRYHLRTKLGLKNRKLNIRSYLKSLDG